MKEFPDSLDRRSFIASAGVTAVVLALPDLLAEAASTMGHIIVSPSGTDDAPGTIAHPVRTLDRALALSGTPGRSTILLRAGTYELAQPLQITGREKFLDKPQKVRTALPITTLTAGHDNIHRVVVPILIPAHISP